MPLSSKPKWMVEHPVWPWFIFIMNTAFIAAVVASTLVLIAQQHRLIREVNDIDRKLVQAVKINQNNVEIVAKKAGVPEHKILRSELPVIPNVK